MQPELTAPVKIGLEVHCQLTSLRTKLFCSCSSDYRSSQPNEKVCPVCFGIPGTLPVLNARAVEHALMIGLALGCSIPEKTLFFRKNYFYPDLPKDFQISQYDKAGGVPIAIQGHLDTGGKRIRITRVQLEEDPGKLTYEGTIDKSAYSLVDYNRAGVALVEIVTEPDFESAKEAKAFLEKLRVTLESLGVSDGELEGAMRCDANVSLEGGARVEIKNISSFKEVEKALNYEILRQRTFSSNASSETRHWDERRSITIAMRSKEEEQDYRYFPEPDIPPIAVPKKYVEEIREKMPEVTHARVARFSGRLGLPPQVAKELAAEKELSAFFDECAKIYPKHVELANFIVSELKPALDAEGGRRLDLAPKDFIELVKMLEERKITRTQAKQALREMIEHHKTAPEVVRSKGLAAVSDESTIRAVVEKVLQDRADVFGRATGGDGKAFSFLVGQVLRAEPRADPRLVANLVQAEVKRRGTKR